MKPNPTSQNQKGKRRKSAKEVTVEVRDSEPLGKRYWNLREINREFEQNQIEEISKLIDDVNDVKNELKIELNINEKFDITEEQRQAILDILVPISEENTEKLEINKTISRNLILIFLLIISGLILALTVLNM